MHPSKGKEFLLSHLKVATVGELIQTSKLSHDVESASLLCSTLVTNPPDDEAKRMAFVLDMEFNDLEPPTTRIKTASEMKIGENIYDMSATPRGYCLIINNICFEGGSLEMRLGACSDGKRLKEIFRQLGFKTILKHNQEKNQMLELCKYIARKNHTDMNAVVVIIMTHGGEEELYAIDNISLEIFKIVDCFSNANSRSLIGKPKMFFFGACRGGE